MERKREVPLSCHTGYKTTICVHIMEFCEEFSSYAVVQFIPFFRMPELLLSSLCFKINKSIDRLEDR